MIFDNAPATPLTEGCVSDTTNADYVANYEYDWVGNRTYETVDGVQTAYEYDDNDRLVETGGKVYDNNGNTLTETLDGDVTTYSYDGRNKMTSVDKDLGGVITTTGYSYNHNGIRSSKTEAATTTNYIVDENRDYAQVLEEVVGAVTEVSYRYGHDLISQNRSGSASASYFHYDGLGSTRALSDASGSLTDTYDYEAFGEVLNETGTTENAYKFTGEQYDNSLNQYYLRARYYDQGVGRFTQMDTYAGNNHDPITLHKYLYGNADPVTYTDPTGNFGLGGLMSGISIGGVLSAAAVGSTSFDLTSMILRGDEITPSTVGATILLGLIGGKILKPLAKACKSGGKGNKCKLALAYTEAELKMRNLVSRTPNSRLNSKRSGTFTVRVVSPVMDVKRGRGTAAFNGPINSVLKSSQLRAHALKFGIYIGQKGACGTNNTVGRCAEWRSANLLLRSGSKVKNLRWLPARSVRKGANGFAELGGIKAACGICDTVGFN